MITETPFGSVDDFKKFSDYLLTSAKSSKSTSFHPQSPTTDKENKLFPQGPPPLSNKQNELFPQDPFGYPLLLTADSKLRIFEKRNKVLLSKYFHLFPTCQNRFVHEDLLELPYSRSYFLSTCDDEEARIKLTNELLQTILPHELRGNIVHNACDHIEYHFLKEVWECLAGEEIFSSVIQVVIKMWALFLSTKNTLFFFNSKDQCLPIIPLEVSSESSDIVVSSKETQLLVSNNTKQVSNILKTLPNVPFLDTNVVPYKVVSKICPQFSKPETILKNLYHVHQINDLTEFMTKDVVKSFIQYLTAINFNSTSCRTLRQLPFFETIDENFTYLNRKKVFVWPSRLPRRGCKKWLSGKKSIFLEANGAWSELHVKTELQIVDITEEDIYVQFVFPNFDKMDQTERFIHLEHIRVYLFNTNYENRQNDDKNISESAINFISALNDLECLEN